MWGHASLDEYFWRTLSAVSATFSRARTRKSYKLETAILFASVKPWKVRGVTITGASQFKGDNFPSINQSAVSLRAEVGTWCMEIYIALLDRMDKDKDKDKCFIINRAPTDTCVYNDNKDFRAVIREVYICKTVPTLHPEGVGCGGGGGWVLRIPSDGDDWI